MNIDPTNDFLNFPNWNSFVFEINGLNVQSEARDPNLANALQSECTDNCSSCPLVYSFQVTQFWKINPSHGLFIQNMNYFQTLRIQSMLDGAVRGLNDNFLPAYGEIGVYGHLETGHEAFTKSQINPRSCDTVQYINYIIYEF